MAPGRDAGVTGWSAVSGDGLRHVDLSSKERSSYCPKIDSPVNNGCGRSSAAIKAALDQIWLGGPPSPRPGKRVLELHAGLLSWRLGAAGDFDARSRPVPPIGCRLPRTAQPGTIGEPFRPGWVVNGANSGNLSKRGQRRLQPRDGAWMCPGGEKYARSKVVAEDGRHRVYRVHLSSICPADRGSCISVAPPC